MSTPAIIPLKCPSCAAKLEVAGELEHFTCGYCGTELIVNRHGGTVSLKVVADAISKVQIGTDEMAAELAIQRLTREIGEVVNQRQALTRAHKERVSRTEDRSSSASGVLGVVVFLILINIRVHHQYPFAYIPGFLIGAGVCVLGIVLGARRRRPAKLAYLDRDRALGEMEAKLREELATHKEVVSINL